MSWIDSGDSSLLARSGSNGSWPSLRALVSQGWPYVCRCPAHEVTRSRFPRCPTPFSIPAYRRFSVHSFVTTTRALPRPRHRVESFLYRLALTGALPIRRGKTLSLTVTFPNEQRIEISEAVVRWSRGQEFAVKLLLMEPHTHGRIQYDYVKRLVQEQAEIVP